ncbi:MAG: TrmO family methyltransferase [Bacteroidales bacterium]
MSEKTKLYIDPEGGIAGDIFTAVLISMGAPERQVIGRMEAAAQKLGDCKIKVQKTREGGKQLHINLHSRENHLDEERSKQILAELFEEYNIPDKYRNFGKKILQILLEAEKKAHSENHFASDHFYISPIGTAHTPYKNEAPFQPDEHAEGSFYIDVFEPYKEGLSDSNTFSELWILGYLDRSEGYSMKVKSPWLEEKIGLFATRSPFRPNPIGMNKVKFKTIQDTRIYTSPFDFLNNTPVTLFSPIF